MSKNEFKQKAGLILVALFAVLVAGLVFGGIGLLFPSNTVQQAQEKQAQEKKTQEQINNTLNQINKDVTDLKQQVQTLDYSKKDTLKKVVIFSNVKNSAKNGKQTETFERKILVNKKINNGYLYVKASVDDKKLSKNESVYVKLIGGVDGIYQEIGGHLRKDKSLEVPLSDDYTELLYKLDEVYYKVSHPYSETVDVESADFSKILNGGGLLKILSFSSTIKSGEIKEMAIYYDCAVGDEDCSVSVE